MGLLYATPRKRSSDVSNEDDKTNEESDCLLSALLQNEDKRKRVKFDSVSDTTLEDLPIELLECILLRVVAMEVKAFKLAKSVWEEKADLVISRLRTVCPQWNSILTTNSFRKKLQRTLGAVQETKIRLEILHETPIDREVVLLTTLKDDLFMLSSAALPNQHCTVKVYDRNNMAEVKEAIPLPGSTTDRLRGCHVSNCVYVLIESNDYLSILRINKDTEDKFNVAPWEYDHKLPISTFSVSANGKLLILSVQEIRGQDFAGIYNANGSLEHRIELPGDIDVAKYDPEVIQRSNGNLIIGIAINPDYQTKLLEVDMNGSVVRQYATSLEDLIYTHVHFADSCGRILITEWFKGMQLFDSECNHLGEYKLQQDEGKTLCLNDLHYESERDEIVRVHYDMNAKIMVLTIFRFTEE